MSVNGELWNDYRKTWENFSQKLDQLQELAETGNREAATAAFLEVEKARLQHNAARDRLAESLSRGIAAADGKRPVSPAAIREDSRIRETAQRLWEFAGRPEHTAESDWHRAEALVRSARA